MEKPRCSSFGKYHIMCFKSDENVTCCNCGGNHEVMSLECPTRVKENEVSKVRAVQSISYAAPVKRVEVLNGAPEESMMVDRSSLKAAGVVVQQQDPDMFKVK